MSDITVIRQKEGLAGEGFNWRGVWDSGTAYVPEDTVEHNGSTWRAMAESTNSEPSDANTDWELVSQKGDPTTDVKNSIEVDAGFLQLVGDEASPAAGKVYRTDNSGSRGWHAGLPHLDVTDFGATGDGSTDDTAAFHSARDALKTAGGGTLFVPEGTYVVDSVTIDGDGITVRGAGMAATVLQLKASATGHVIEFDEASAGVGAFDQAIRDLTIDGNKANQDDAGTHVGLRVVRVTRFVGERLHIHDCDGYGVGMVGSDQANRADQTLRDIWLNANFYDGLDVKSGDPGIDRVTFVNVNSWNNGGGSDGTRDAVGIDVRGSDVSLVGCRAWDNDDHQIRVRSAGEDAALHGCHVNGGGNDLSGIRIVGGHATVVGCSARNAREGVRADDSATILGGVFEKNKTAGVWMTEPAVVSGALIKNNGTGTASGRGVFIQGVTGGAWRVSDCLITDDDVGDQEYGIYFGGTPDPGIIVGNDLQGNATAVQNQDAPSGSEAVANLPTVSVAA